MVENGSLTLEDKLKLESWGLPSYILQKYLKKGISSMFTWQLECLTSGDVLQGGNLVYSAPTSAGKTLVAEILALQTVLERKKKVIMILPFVSVVREKMLYFQDILTGSGVRVEGFMGSYHPPGGFRAVHMAICTIEKANNLINRLLEEREFDDLGCVIVDELHLVGDPHRGYLLELLMTKVKYICENKLAPPIQIVGMSATLPNLDLLAKWLNATLYRTDFRPVPLVEHLKVMNKIYKASELHSSQEIELKFAIDNDPGDVIYLCVETILNGFSVIVFCPTKAWCETLAQQISGQIKKLGNTSNEVGLALREQLDSNAISDILGQLRKTQVGLDPCLGKSVAFGVGFHHAGLTMDERDIIEGGFRSNVIRALVATSTLSSGVNLPARRVIIRSPSANGRMLDILSYKQMIGRAGRMGKDCLGESFLICSEENKNQGHQLVTLGLPPIASCLGGVHLTSSLKRAILEVIASRAACCFSDVELYAKCTLLAASVDQTTISSAVESCIAYLQSKDFIIVGVDSIINASALAEACLSASLPPEQALSLLAELDKSRKCFVLETDLHAIYQVTPLSVANQWTIDWMKFLSIWEESLDAVRKVGRLVGVDETFLIKSMRGTVNTVSDNKVADKVAAHKRFYAALALQDLINEVPLMEVANKYGCNKGVLQSLQQSTSSFCGMVTNFCRKLKWGTLEVVIAQLGQRLHFGAQSDLLDLLQLECMTATMARILYNSGITLLSELAGASLENVQTAIHRGTPFIRQEDAVDGRIKRDVYLPGRPGLTEPEAADILIHEARIFLVRRLGLKDAVWGNDTRSIHDETTVMPAGNESRRSIPCGTGSTKLSESSKLFKEQCMATPDDNGNRKSFELLVKPLKPGVRVSKIGDCSCNTSGSEKLIASESPPIATSDKPENPNYLRLSLHLGDNDLDLSAGKFKEGRSSTPCDPHAPTLLAVEKKKSRLSLETNASETDMFADSSQNLSSSLICAAEANQPLESLDSNWGGDSLLIASQLINDYKSVRSSERFSAKRKLLEEENSPVFKKLKTSETFKAESTSGMNVSQLFSDSLVLCTQLENLLNEGNDCANKPSPKTEPTKEHKISMTDSFLAAALQESFELDEAIVVKKPDMPDFIDTLEMETPKEDTPDVSPQPSCAVEKLCSPPRNENFLTNTSFRKLSPMSTPQKRNRAKSRLSHKNSPVSSKYSPVVMVVKKGDSRLNRSKSFSSTSVPENANDQSKSFKRFKSIDWITDLDKIDDHSSDEESMGRTLKPAEAAQPTLKPPSPLALPLSDNPLGSLESTKIKYVCHDIREVKLFLTAVLREKKLVFDADWGTGGSETFKIGGRILNKSPTGESKSELASGNLVLIGMYWKLGNDVYYTTTKKSDCVCLGSVKLILQMKDIELWGYDIKTLIKKLHRCSGILIQCKVRDICVADWLISSSEHRKSLKDLVKEHIEQQKLGRINVHEDEKLRAVHSVDFLREKLVNLLERCQLLDWFNDVEMPVQALLASVELNGMGFDRGLCSELWTKVEQQMKQLEDAAHGWAGRGFSLSSYNDVRKVRQSIEMKSGTNKDHPINSAISNWRKLSSLKTRNMSQLLSADIVNGRCESVSNTFTATGRIVMYEPSIQHTPRDFYVEGNRFSLRSSFLAAEGNVLVSADFSQLELRILAHFSEDSSLISAILGESDIFVSIASKWNNISRDQVTDEIRQQTKQIIYGIIYGMGDRSLGEALGVSASDAAMMASTFRRSYPGVQRFLESCVNQCKCKGYIVTLKGRRRLLPGIHSSVKNVRSQAERQAVNSTIQGSAADIAKAAAVNVEHGLYRSLLRRSPLITPEAASHLVLHLHDELIYEVSHKHLKTVCDVLRREMNSVVQLLVPLPVVIKAGPSWGELKPVD